MSDLVEKVARALARIDGCDPDHIDRRGRVQWTLWEDDARTVLAAIEASGHRIVPVEITQAMYAAWPDWSAMLAAAPKVTP